MGSQRRFGAWTIVAILGIVCLFLVSAEASLIDERAPELSNTVWINSAPLRLADLQGKVILLEFWTYGCINCRNTIPQLVDWHKRFGPRGLVIIGIHSPEFDWEHPLDKVTSACKELGISYPVALDNDFATWNRYRTRYWPTLHVIDKHGIIRHTRIGEGGYAETEAMIQRLLKE